MTTLIESLLKSFEIIKMSESIGTQKMTIDVTRSLVDYHLGLLHYGVNVNGISATRRSELDKLPFSKEARKIKNDMEMASGKPLTAAQISKLFTLEHRCEHRTLEALIRDCKIEEASSRYSVVIITKEEDRKLRAASKEGFTDEARYDFAKIKLEHE